MKCKAPILLKNPKFAPDRTRGQERTVPVRCGSCEGCLKSKINDWAFRLEQEGKRALHVHFVTLTYDPSFVPLTDTLLPTLSKRDVQLFLKRLRKLQNHGNIKYFIAGEYGSTTYRPHYHIILFNCDNQQHIQDAWTVENAPIGNTHIVNDISNGAIPYTLKYMYKKGLIPATDTDDRIPEFRLMSQKLGLNYLTPAVIKWHLADPKNRMYVRTDSGINIAMPRYFREKLIEISGKSRLAFLPDDEQEIFLTHDSDDYRSLESRIEKIKQDQDKFIHKSNQTKRNKI
ncbi:replication initiator protein [Microviridae sp.]|nr:replication initiator protein [Microviridae sp.]